MKKTILLLAAAAFVLAGFRVAGGQKIAEDELKGESEESLAKLEVRDKRASAKAKEFSNNRAKESRVVKAMPLLRSAEEKDIFAELNEARMAGDEIAASVLQARLDELHGIFPNAFSQEAREDQDQVHFGKPSQGPGFRWVEGDILINDPSNDVVKPSMASAPSGDLYVAVEDRDGIWIDLYRSRDGGRRWSMFIGFASGVDSTNPSLTYAEYPDENWVYVAYEGNYADDSKAVKVFRVNPDSLSSAFATVQSGIYMSSPDQHIHPEICTDDLEYNYPWIYVTYEVYGIDYYPVYFSRSTDRGLTWSTPQNVTGGAENSTWQTRPHIAFGTTWNTLFIAFEKLGFTASSSSRERSSEDENQEYEKEAESFPSAPTPAPPEGGCVTGAEVSEPAVPTVFDGDLRDLPKVPEWRPGDLEMIMPKGDPGESQDTGERPAVDVPSPGPDPLLDLQEDAPGREESRAFGTPDLNFAGQGYTGSRPPDTVGDVGSNYYIQAVNNPAGSVFTIYNKSDGSVAAGPTRMETLATSGACTNGYCDPIVIYDELADRWVLTEFAQKSEGNHLCVYVSQTSDPISGGWYAYDFSVPQFPDYQKCVVWPDAYYVSSNEASGPAAYALQRSQMLNGNPASWQRFTISDMSGFSGFQALTPADLDGATAPPSGAPGYFIRHRDDEAHNPGSNDPSQDFLEIYEFDVDWTTPANSTFTGPTNIGVTEFDSDLCGLTSWNCVAQPGTTVELDPLREVVMWRLQYRNFSTHETLVGNFVTDADGTDHHGIRWFELRKSGGGSWSVYQEGTYAPDAHHRWMGSIAMDGAGNVALGYSVSSGTVYPSIRYVGRESTDTLGTMPHGEHTIIGGLGSSTNNRWGDYSSMNVDPADDCTFWYTNEYGIADGTWATQIAAFNFDSCFPGSWDKQIFVTKSTNWGSSWGTPVRITSSTDEQYHPRIAAAHGLDSVVVAYTRDWQDSGDLDVCYGYSTDGGSTWDTDYWLPWTYDDEKSVALSVSNDEGRFHAAFWRGYDIRYTYDNASDPSPPWAATVVVNELNYASSIYSRPTVCVNPTKAENKEACVAWTDWRQTYYDVYFDTVYLPIAIMPWLLPLLLAD